MKVHKKIYGSVASRTTFIVLAVLTIILVSAGLWQMKYAKQLVADEVRWQATRSMESATKVIDNRMRNIETAVNVAAEYGGVAAADEKQVLRFLDGFISSLDDITAATILYKADYFPQHGRYFAPTVVRDSAGNGIHHYEIGGPEHNFCYLETDSNWVYTNKLKHGYWSLPFVAISTRHAMVSYSVPLYDSNGSIFAVLCASVDLRWVEKIVEEAKPYEYAKVSVLSRDARFICHPDPNSVMSVNAIALAREKGGEKAVELTNKMLRLEYGIDTMTAPLITSKTSVDSTSTTPQKTEDLVVYYAPIERMQWSVSYTIPESKIMEHPNELGRNMLKLLAILLVVISMVIYIIIRAQLYPLKQLVKSAQNVAEGNFKMKLPVINTQDEISRLRDAFESMQVSLDEYFNKLQETAASKASIESELRIASGIQMAMLPKTYPPYPDREDIDIYGSLTPAKEIGGDIFDFYIRDEKLFFCIGDVSGKGVPASLVMAVTKTLFRSVSSHEASPERIVTSINETMSEKNDSNMFVTLFVGVLDLPSGRMRYCNAGHDAPVLMGMSVGHLPVDSNVPVGVMPHWKFTAQETKIDPQTVIFLYTDGLTEAENESHGQFGEKRMLETASNKLKEMSPKAIIEKMTEEVNAFVGNAEQSDDLTMLAIQYTKHQHDVKMQRSITLVNDVQEVGKLAEFVDGVCETIGLGMSEAMQLNLAMEEAVVNVMNYAYPAGEKGDINIEAQANDVELKFVISDNGIAFDPTSKESVDTSLDVDERPIGGLGIHLIRNLMDSINYERTDGKNVLTLLKKLKND